MNGTVNRYIIAYDISDDRRRTRIAKYLERFAVRAQYSVFIADLRPARLARVQQDLERLMRPREDSVMICRLGPASQIEKSSFQWLGVRGHEPPTEAIVV